MTEQMKALANQFREMIDEHNKSIAMFERGKIQLLENGNDISADHIEHLRTWIENLEAGISDCERGKD